MKTLEKLVHKAYIKRAMLESEVKADVRKLCTELAEKVSESSSADLIKELTEITSALSLYSDILDEAKDEYELAANTLAEAMYREKWEDRHDGRDVS